MDDADSKKRERSPNFPFIGLDVALSRARQFYDKERRGSAAVLVVAQHWGYSPKSSGLTQTIAALKSYGLMEDEGRGDSRRIRLSERALRILLDNRLDSQERKEAIHHAALSPSLCNSIFEKFPNDFPSDANLEHFLLFELKFNPDSAKAVVKILKENKEYIGRMESVVVSEHEEQTGNEIMTHGIGANPIQASQAKAVASNVSAMERIIGPEGEIILQWGGTPTWESYDFLEDYIKLRKKILKQGASSGNPKDKDD